MNILLVEYNNFCCEDVVAAMTTMGHSVVRLELPQMRERVNAEGAKVLEAAIEQGARVNGAAAEFDCVFSFNYSPVISNCCKALELKYIAWVYDSPQVLLYSYTIINPCNYIFVFDRAQYEAFHKEGITTIYYMPLAANVKRLDKMQVTPSIREKLQSAVAFVGSMYNEEHNLFDRMKGLPEFTKGFLDGVMAAQLQVQGYFFVEEMLKGKILEDMKRSLEYKPNQDGVETPEYVYANYFLARKMAELERNDLIGKVSEQFQTRIYTHQPTPKLPGAVNMGAVDYYKVMPYVFKCSDINLNISLRSIQTGIPLRCMDIMGAGGFLLSNYQADLCAHFVPGEDFVYYESAEDLLAKCSYYLKHDAQRRQIAANGHGRAAAECTYEQRLTEMLSIAFAS